MDQPSPPKEPRGPVSLRIKFRSASLDQFIERYAVDVSRGGIFIRTREPLAVGTPLKFDFQLQDAAPLLAGEGTVVWIRENDPSRANVTPGMGVRFDKLTPSSQPVLEKILAEKARRELSGTAPKPSTGGGMAVRRPSSTFSALDPAAARAALAAGAPPRATTSAAGSAPPGAQPRVPASATGSGPLGAQPRVPASAAGSGPLGTRSRPAESAAPRPAPSSMTARPPASLPAPTLPAPARPKSPPAGLPTLESSGAFGRARHTTGMNAQRTAPAPQALFEKPTPEDIDRALAVLTEMDDAAPAAPVAGPVDFSGRTTSRRPTDAQPMVLESAPDLGDLPGTRRTGTQPLFSSHEPPELRVPTVPVVPLGHKLPSDDEGVVDAEDDATLAWSNSGPTTVGGDPSGLPEKPAADVPPLWPPRTPTPPPHPVLATREDFLAAVLEPAPAPAPAASPPAAVSGARATPRPTSRSSAPLLVGLVLMVGAGGAVFLFKRPHPNGGRPAEPAVASPTSATPTPDPAAVIAEAMEKTGLAPGEKIAAADAGVAPAAAAGEPDKAKATVAPIGAATPATLRPRPSGPAPDKMQRAGEAKSGEAKSGEAKSGEAKPGEAKPGEAKLAETSKPAAASADAPEHPSKGKGGPRRRAAAAEAPTPSTDSPAATKVENVSPSETAAAKEPAKGASVLKISSTPAGAEVIVDGASVGKTPYLGNDVDPALPHSITLKRDGFEDHEHMISASDWPRAHSGVRTLKLNVKLRSTSTSATAPAAVSPDSTQPAPGEGTTPASPHRE
jgi:uncharacterized protein (TIGR02266 family)